MTRVGIRATLALSCALLCAPAGAQGLPAQLGKLGPSWETRLAAGDGQKVRQEAEALLNRPDIAILESSYMDQHAKVGVLGFAARGAVLEGDWQGAVSLLTQAAAAAKVNYAATSATMLGLRGQHEAKIVEWKDLMVPREEQLNSLRELPGLRSEQIRQYSELETFLSEHRNAIASSEQSIRDIDDILSLLKTEEETNSRSLGEWSGFLARESAEIQELGSAQRYVTEKLAQVAGNDRMSRFERVSFAMRLQRLDPANAAVKGFLNSLLGAKKPEPAAPAKAAAKAPVKTLVKPPAKAPPKKMPAKLVPAKQAPAKPAAPKPAAADGAEAGKADTDKTAPADSADAAKTDLAKAEPPAAEPAKAEPAKVEPAKAEPAKAEPPKVEPEKTEPPKTEPGKAP
jgi:hypothetical protein